jgi:hypothetical protein
MDKTENTNPSLWNKPVNDLTVADSVKLNLAALGVVAGIAASLVAVGVAADKFQAWKANRDKTDLTVVSE